MKEEIFSQKSKIRKRMLLLRKQKYKINTFDSSNLHICIEKNIKILKRTVVAGYHAIMNELDLDYTLKKLSKKGIETALPVVDSLEDKIFFYKWRYGDELVSGPFNTFQPSLLKLELLPDLIFVPLLAFDDNGFRLGYGKGFYDEAILRLRKKKNIKVYGIGYDWQQVDVIPRTDLDQKLDGIITPNKFIRISKCEKY